MENQVFICAAIESIQNSVSLQKKSHLQNYVKKLSVQYAYLNIIKRLVVYPEITKLIIFKKIIHLLREKIKSASEDAFCSNLFKLILYTCNPNEPTSFKNKDDLLREMKIVYDCIFLNATVPYLHLMIKNAFMLSKLYRILETEDYFLYNIYNYIKILKKQKQHDPFVRMFYRYYFNKKSILIKKYHINEYIKTILANEYALLRLYFARFYKKYIKCMVRKNLIKFKKLKKFLLCQNKNKKVSA